MNTGQTLLAIGALVLLGMTVLTTNRSSMQHGTIVNQAEVGLYAVSLAQGKIEEAAGKAFDTWSASDTAGSGAVITSLTQLTSPTLLGKEGAEAYPTPGFDDFDDYNYYGAGKAPYTFYVPGVDTFYIQTTVVYVDTLAPDTPVATQTWHKKMTVKVWPWSTPWATGTRDTITMTYVYSYWWFR